jgi:hypothetical protein
VLCVHAALLTLTTAPRPAGGASSGHWSAWGLRLEGAETASACPVSLVCVVRGCLRTLLTASVGNRYRRTGLLRPIVCPRLYPHPRTRDIHAPVLRQLKVGPATDPRPEGVGIRHSVWPRWCDLLDLAIHVQPGKQSVTWPRAHASRQGGHLCGQIHQEKHAHGDRSTISCALLGVARSLPPDPLRAPARPRAPDRPPTIGREARWSAVSAWAVRPRPAAACMARQTRVHRTGATRKGVHVERAQRRPMRTTDEEALRGNAWTDRLLCDILLLRGGRYAT